MINSFAVTAVSAIANIVAISSAAVATATGFFWADIGPKKALVCELSELDACLIQLPSLARAQLPRSPHRFKSLLGQRGAMVLPLKDVNIAGLVITDFVNLPARQTINWGVGHFSLILNQQAQVTYWHELGHLFAVEALAKQNKRLTSPYQHEWMADVYLVWRIAHETNSLALAWQQYHRRNLAVMADSEFMSHWSVPVLAQMLERYTAAELQQFSSFNDFWQDFSASLVLHDNDSLNEFSSLMQRTFGAGTVQPLPGYMYWRKPKLGQYLKPTLEHIMGAAEAQRWLTSQQMATDSQLNY
ncbi:hypothetical protein TUM4438_35930 [Shewanella sairae]|uniref:Uncharacterized protein n=1 Tax=Shewanella sairae TaxID=190310 RepID=A0ABQ4PPL6_9GAMM|nr:hypothetical protein [Shewanella sairae]MCL1129727.1 hypothetical protein [Shewanella sairae]GIU50333.1 hypothetical protein TUM4438_35930 [Shewanella sairae]